MCEKEKTKFIRNLNERWSLWKCVHCGLYRAFPTPVQPPCSCDQTTQLYALYDLAYALSIAAEGSNTYSTIQRLQQIIIDCRAKFKE